MPDSTTNAITLIKELEREAQAAGLETTAGNTGDPSDLPGWMLAALCPALLVDAGDGTMLAILLHQDYINAVEIHGNSYTGKEPPPVEATAEGLASIAATARKWIAGHASSAAIFSTSDPRASMLLAVHVGRVRSSLAEERVAWQPTDGVISGIHLDWLLQEGFITGPGGDGTCTTSALTATGQSLLIVVHGIIPDMP